MKTVRAARSNLILVSMLVGAFTIMGCDSGGSDDGGDGGGGGITAKWDSKSTMTYSYSRGVLSAANCSAKFEVLNGSGTMNVTVSLMNPETGDPKSGSFTVKKGDIVTVSTRIGFSGRKNCSPGSEPKIEFESPSISSKNTFSSPSEFDPLFGWQCPKPASIGDLTFSAQ